MIELVAAMAASSALLVGLGSVMLIARQIAFSPATPQQRIDAAQMINEIAADLRFATVIVEQSAYVLDFTVADRDGDGAAERFRYQWSGTPGDPLTRSRNNGTAVTVLDDVKQFSVTPVLESESNTLQTYVTSAEQLLVGNTNTQTGVARDITATAYSAQQVNPATFASVPSNATCWNATRIDFVGLKIGTYTETLLVQLRRAGDPYNGPTSNVLGQVSIPEASLTATLGWNTATFASPITGLPLHRRFNIVLAGVGSGAAIRLLANDTAASGVLESSDAGASWSYISNRQIYYRLYGSYNTPGSQYSVTRNIVRQIQLALRTGDQGYARVDASVPLLNRPEQLAKYWRVDFDSNPTTHDCDRDGTADWAVTGGGSFDTNNLAYGVWTATDALESRPLNDFTGVTTIDVGFRNTSVGGNGAVVQIDADRQSGVHAPIRAYLQLKSDGTQTLSLYGKSSDATNVPLFSRSNLPNEMIRMRLKIVPANNVVNLQINDEDQGSFVYSTYAPTTNDRFLKLYADTSAAQFDYAEVRVATP
jgi:hypothetical protein